MQDDHIREVALGGPDTCTRAQVVWQLKALLRPENAEQFDCTSLKSLLARTLPQLRARARSGQAAHRVVRDLARVCYRGAENQLYRVEVHKSGTATEGANDLQHSNGRGKTARSYSQSSARRNHGGRRRTWVVTNACR